MNYTLRSRQLNPCDHLFWKSRGYLERPSNWREILIDFGYYDDDDYDDDDDDGYYDYNDNDEYDEDEYEDDDDDEYEDDDDEDSDDDDYDADHEEEYYDESDDSDYEEQRLNSIQNNPNNTEFWQLRGWSDRPDDWRERIYENRY